MSPLQTIPYVLENAEGQLLTRYPDLKSMPEKPDAVFILASPAGTEQIVQQCIDLGMKRIWMHCQMGVKPRLSPANTNVSLSAVEKCRAHGMTTIPGSCPTQFLGPDLGHAVMHRLWGWLGYLNLDGAKS